MTNMFVFFWFYRLKLNLDSYKEIIQHDKNELASLNKKIVAKDKKIEGLKVRLIILKQSMDTIWKIHGTLG